MTRIKEEQKSKYLLLVGDEYSAESKVNEARAHLVKCESSQVSDAAIRLDVAWKRLDAAQKSLRAFLLDDSNFQ